MQARGPRIPAVLAFGTALALAACSTVEQYNPFAGDSGEPAAQAMPNAPPDERGVITYASYQVAVARDGDTIATVASRVGTTPEALARRNALPGDYLLRTGEVLLLPDSMPRPESGFATAAVTTEGQWWTRSSS